MSMSTSYTIHYYQLCRPVDCQSLVARYSGSRGLALFYERGRGCDEDDVVRTADFVQGFIDACREYRGTENDTFEELPVKIIYDSQRFRGEQRRDLYILDADEHVRLVIAI